MRLALAAIFQLIFLANISAQTSENSEVLPMKFGINLGLNYSNATAEEELPAGASLSNGFGFRLEILTEYQMLQKVFVSPKIGFSFNDSRLNFNENIEEELEFLILPVSLDISTHFQFKKNSPNRRPYVFIGPSLKLPVQPREDWQSDFGSSWTPSMDFGLGFDKDFGYFQFAPEFRYSIGIRNVANLETVGDIYFHNFSILFNFLG